MTMNLVSTLKGIALFLVLFIPISLFSQETSCNNGIDDDGDGLVDCYDPDCGSDPTCDYFFFGQPENTSCQYPQPGAYILDTSWASAAKVFPNSTAVAGDIDNDGVVEVVVCKGLTPGQTDSIVVINGNTGAIEFIFAAGGFNVGGSKGDVIGLADVDNDGFGEIVLVDLLRTVKCFEHDGTPKWTSATPLATPGVSTFAASPLFADFDQDGNVEVYMRRQIWNGQNGNIIATGTGSLGQGDNALMPAAVDVLPTGFPGCPDCDGLELVAGDNVYSVNIGTGAMTVRESAASGNGDGLTSIADFDLDGDMDAIVVSQGAGGLANVWCGIFKLMPRLGLPKQ